MAWQERETGATTAAGCEIGGAVVVYGTLRLKVLVTEWRDAFVPVPGSQVPAAVRLASRALPMGVTNVAVDLSRLIGALSGAQRCD